MGWREGKGRQVWWMIAWLSDMGVLQNWGEGLGDKDGVEVGEFTRFYFGGLGRCDHRKG